MLTPDKVFTPGKPPVEQTNVYVARGQAQSDLGKAIQRSFVPVIFGEYGVGKTSLARNVVLDADRQGRLVNVESVDGRTFGSVLEQILEHVGYMIEQRVTTSDSESSTMSAGGSIGGSFAGFQAKARSDFKSETSTAETVERHLVITSPSDSKILDICESRGLVLLLDELHKASRGFVRDLSSFIKAFHNKPCQRFHVILVGTSSDASRLVEHDPGIDRVVQELPLAGMSNEEAGALIRTGMNKLAIGIEEQSIVKVVRTAVGSPALVQFLALEIAEAAFTRDPRRVLDGDFDHALKEYVGKRAARLNSLYLKAIETIGPKRYRKRVLHAMSVLSDEYVTMDQVVSQVSKDLGENTPSSALSGPLRDLKTPEFGSILKDLERHEEGERVYNYSTFTDPAMKAFIRMRYAAEQDGLDLDSSLNF